ALAGLACLAAIAGDHATAAAAVAEARAELGGRRQVITAATLRYAEGILAWHRGELADAERMVREATMQWHHGSDRMGACDGIELLGVLGDDRFAQAWDQGQALTLDDAVAYAARKGGGRKRPATGWASLTPAELEVVRLVGEGLRNDAIARRLFIAPGTVKVHLSHVFATLAITTRAELAAQAASRDLTAR
ncbi:MAG TPA: LuxR C-terminal-related transcriptional regulator, partial [Streptosporangiaceae bacterium]|nr:LuxR C-terminal-related transcriptional regulator [Streptosporangiaceae bacterium]